MILPDPNLGSASMPWARAVNDYVNSSDSRIGRLEQSQNNSASSLNTSIGVLADQVRRGVANSYTKAEIDTLLAAQDATIASLATTVSGKANASHTHDAGDIVSGTIARPVNTGGDIATSANMYSVGAYNTDLGAVSGRRTMWIGPDGRMGHTASSRRFKQDIENFDWDYETIRKVRVVMFRYIAAVEDHGDDAEWELGVIAEELDELGLWFIVDYVRDVPYSVKFHMFAFLALWLAQKQSDMIEDIQARLSALEAR